MASFKKWILSCYFCILFLSFLGCESRARYRVLWKLKRTHPARSIKKVSMGVEVNVTPLIKKGMIKKAKELSFNRKPFCGHSRSFSGFLTVEGLPGKASRAKTFFWLFPSLRNQDKQVPVMLWLQGGPGVPGVYGSLVENGPCSIKENGRTRRRLYSWTRIMNMIYIDNPVGTGYSYTNGTYPTTQTEAAYQLYDAVQQLLDMFPQYRKRPFYIGGESYGGKFVTSLAHKIHKGNGVSQYKRINLQGIAIGNGLVDPPNMLVNTEVLVQLGFLDDKTANYFRNKSALILEDVKNENWLKAALTTVDLFLKQSKKSPNALSNVTQYKVLYNAVNPKYDTKEEMIYKLGNLPFMKKALHVGSARLKKPTEIAMVSYYPDLMKTVINQFVEVAENYNVLLYGGQLDMIIPYVATVNYVRKMKWSQSKAYAQAERKVWRVDKEVAGYTKTVYHRKDNKTLHFTEMLVRGAGHLVVIDKPSFAFRMMSQFISKRKPW